MKLAALEKKKKPNDRKHRKKPNTVEKIGVEGVDVKSNGDKPTTAEAIKKPAGKKQGGKGKSAISDVTKPVDVVASTKVDDAALSLPKASIICNNNVDS